LLSCWSDPLFRALDNNGELVDPTTLGRALCPGCKGLMIAKCGEIVVDHWAHAAGVDCDPWSEPESQWHKSWKDTLASVGAETEVVVGNHRADAVLADGTVVELQTSSISPAEIREREAFYGKMVWLFNGWGLNLRSHAVRDDNIMWFRWLWPRKTWWHVTKPMYWHIPQGILEVRQVNQMLPCYGYGFLHSQDVFIAEAGVAPPTPLSPLVVEKRARRKPPVPSSFVAARRAARKMKS
jgi:competence protein CoiA